MAKRTSYQTDLYNSVGECGRCLVSDTGQCDLHGAPLACPTCGTRQGEHLPSCENRP
jgi:hypothetical protein